MDDEVMSEATAWANDSFTDSERLGALHVIHWAHARELYGSIVGDSFWVAFPHLPASDGWLMVSRLENTVIVELGKLAGYPPFEGDARRRLMEKLKRGGDFLQGSGSKVFARVDLATLATELEWKTLEWRLDQIVELGSSTRPSATDGPEPGGPEAG